MKALFSTAYLPPVAYMAALVRQSDALIEARETFPKQTYRNRALIMTAEGVRMLSVPVLRNNHSRTDEVAIDYRDRWNIIHLRTLTAAYSASPYFLYYRDGLEKILIQHYDRLIDLNQALLEWLLEKLKIECRIGLTDDWLPPTESEMDFRFRFSPKKLYPTDGFKPYYQVFEDRIPFTPNLSVVDLLMNLGPEASDYLKKVM